MSVPEPKPGDITPEEYFERYLADLERGWLAGNTHCLVEAVRYCSDDEKPLPRWVTKAVLGVLEKNIKPISQSMRVHLRRWRAVRAMMTGSKQALKEQGYEINWDSVYEQAQNELKGSEAAAKPGTIARSYKKINGIIKTHGEVALYRLLTDL